MEPQNNDAHIAVIQNEIGNLKSQYYHIADRLDTLEGEIGSLKMADQKMNDTLNYHIISEEKNWKLLFKALIIVGIAAIVGAIGNWQGIVELIKIFL